MNDIASTTKPGLNYKLAVRVTRAMGSMWALYVIIGVITLWSVTQMLMGDKAFDPYPFPFLLFLGNVLQLLLMPIIMVGQKIFAGQDEARAIAEYETTLAIQREVGALRFQLAEALERLRAAPSRSQVSRRRRSSRQQRIRTGCRKGKQ